MKSNQQQPYFLKHLIEAGAVSGPLDASINNSGLGRIKRILTGGAPFLGGERYLVFGTEMHYRCLERKKGKWKPVDAIEKDQMEGGVKALHKLKLFTESLPGAIVEKTVYKANAFGIHAMHGTIDLRKIFRKGKRKVRRIIDLKTTSAETEDEFMRKANDLAYPRQLTVYDEIAPEEVDESENIIIGISKFNNGTKYRPNYPTFIYDLNNFPNERKRALTEAEFLLTFYDTLGLPIKGGIKNEVLTNFLGGPDSEQTSRRTRR